MPLVRACAPVPEVDLLAAYGEYCDRLGLTGVNLRPAARTFLRRWPDPQRWAEEPTRDAAGGVGNHSGVRDVSDAGRASPAWL